MSLAYRNQSIDLQGEKGKSERDIGPYMKGTLVVKGLTAKSYKRFLKKATP